MTHAEAEELVTRHGGNVADRVTHQTDFLIVGQHGWPLRKDGRLASKLLDAQALQAQGHVIDILSEEEFLEQAGLEENAQQVHRLYTLAQLAKILDLPQDVLRRWKRLGLIQPTHVRHRLEFFDFSQVTGARSLAELIQQGVTPGRIRESLHALKQSLPVAELSMVQLAAAMGKSSLLFRWPDGELADAYGQCHFDFIDEEPSPPSISITNAARTYEQWLHIGLELEAEGQLAEAADAYSEAMLLRGPDPVCCFNLANVLYAMGERVRAVERYRQAVELDPSYVEAWNNLGNTLADLGDVDRAIAAFRRALQIDPEYPDAHYNLAETLEQIGCYEEARQHWLAYLRLDPRSNWADEVRRRIGR